MKRMGAALASAAILAACGAASADTVRVTDGYVRAPLGGSDVTAGYGVITAASDDALIAATSPQVGQIELHTHEHDNGVMRMRQVSAIELPAGEAVTLKPGGLHLMLFGVDEALAAGDTVEITLDFRTAPDQTLSVPVRDLAAGHRDHSAHGHP